MTVKNYTTYKNTNSPLINKNVKNLCSKKKNKKNLCSKKKIKKISEPKKK